MSWGERICSHEKAPKNEYGGCAVATIENCNVDCPYYTWDKKTKPDSVTNKIFNVSHLENFRKRMLESRGIVVCDICSKQVSVNDAIKTLDNKYWCKNCIKENGIDK